MTSVVLIYPLDNTDMRIILHPGLEFTSIRLSSNVIIRHVITLSQYYSTVYQELVFNQFRLHSGHHILFSKLNFTILFTRADIFTLNSEDATRDCKMLLLSFVL